MDQDDRERLEEYAEYLPGLTKYTQIYVEGLPKRVGAPGVMGVRALMQTVEEILQWELQPNTEYALTDIVMFQRFPTEGGPYGNETYGTIMTLQHRGMSPILYKSYPVFGLMHSSDENRPKRQACRIVRRAFRNEQQKEEYTTFVITAVPDWLRTDHLKESEVSFFVFDVRAMELGCGQRVSMQRSQEFEAYANWMLVLFKQFMVDVVEGITDVDNMILLYRILRHSSQERNAAAEVQELVLQVRFRVRSTMTRVDCMSKVAAIQERMGIDQPPYRAGWLLRGNPVEVLTKAANRNDPLHSVFHCPRGDMYPMPYIRIYDIPVRWNKELLLRTLPTEVLRAIRGYIWIAGDTPGYPTTARMRPTTTEYDSLMLILWRSTNPNPFVQIPYNTLVTMGRSEDFPAKIEQHGDLPNFDRLRARAMAPQVQSQLLASLAGGRTGEVDSGTRSTGAWSGTANIQAPAVHTLDSHEFPTLTGDSRPDRMEVERERSATMRARTDMENEATATQASQ
jgi:hypothetical protein